MNKSGDFMYKNGIAGRSELKNSKFNTVTNTSIDNLNYSNECNDAGNKNNLFYIF